MARKKKHEEHVNHERWLVSYADFITLLFATFTALYAISNADKEKFAALAKSLRNSFSTDKPTQVERPHMKGRGIEEHSLKYHVNLFPEQRRRGNSKRQVGDPIDPSGPAGNEKGGELSGNPGEGGVDRTDENSDELETQTNEHGTAEGDPGPKGEGAGSGAWVRETEGNLVSFIDENNLANALQTRREGEALVVSLSEAAFFDTESAYVRGESVHTLQKLFHLLKDKGYRLHLEAHTDNTPPKSGRYQDNWDLTAQRASRLLKYLIEEQDFSDDLISSSAHGSSRPIAENTSARGRALNRRVDIIVLPSEANLYDR